MRKNWRSLFGAVVGVAFLVWALHGIHFDEVWVHIRNANPWYLLGASVAGTLIFPLRAPRWRIILSPVAEDLPFGMLWRAIAIGMMGNNVLPARAGELARAFALSRETKRVPFSAAFASLAVDRIFDATCVLLLMAVATLDPSLPKGETFGGYSIAKIIGSGAALALVAISGLYLIVFFTERAILVWEWVARMVAPHYEERGRRIILAFAMGLAVLRNPVKFVSAMAWSIVMWLMNALAFWLGFKAVGIEVSFSAALMLQGLIAIGVAVPALPGFFGVFEKFAQIGLGVYGIDRTLATSWAISYHILTFLPITIIGIYYFVTLGLKLSDMNATSEEAAEAATESK
ncbi:MAG TPA: lysylphosphatidylglycerol synthase transmembrane domain-containing protein [Gemmatimonadaceae bacterium]|nr:lysylphosphatidylglycerol synthase transmembrane domain-containing protein [Gemmatimonadaceae bacterium]